MHARACVCVWGGGGGGEVFHFEFHFDPVLMRFLAFSMYRIVLFFFSTNKIILV